MSELPPIQDQPNPGQPAFNEPPQAMQSPKKKLPVWAWLLIVFVACGVCGIPVLAAILFPVFSQAKIAAKRTNAVTHAKQISMAAILYSADADDMFPPFDSSQEIATKLDKFFVAPDQPVGATRDNLHDIATTYTWNTEISGLSATMMDVKSWMFYNPEKFGDKKVLAHLDSSVKSLTEEEFNAALAIPASPTGIGNAPGSGETP